MPPSLGIVGSARRRRRCKRWLRHAHTPPSSIPGDLAHQLSRGWASSTSNVRKTERAHPQLVDTRLNRVVACCANHLAVCATQRLHTRLPGGRGQPPVSGGAGGGPPPRLAGGRGQPPLSGDAGG